MGGLQSFLPGLCLALSVPAPPLCAQTPVLPDPVSLFATCTGRLSALMEYQWLVQDPHSGPTEVRRNQMADLLAAAVAPGQEVRAMDLRVQAKQAEAALLQEALFGHGGRAAWAKTQAARQLARCTALLLS